MPFAANGVATLLVDSPRPWVSLHSGAVPSSTNEITFAGYERKQVTSWQYGTAAARAIVQTEAVATGRWTGIRSIGWWTAETGGSLIAYRNYATPLVVEVAARFGFNTAGKELDIGVPLPATRTQGGWAASVRVLATYMLGFRRRWNELFVHFYSTRPRSPAGSRADASWNTGRINALSRARIPFERSGNIIRNRDQIVFAAVSAQTAAPTHWLVGFTDIYDYVFFYGQMAAATPAIPANTDWAIAAHAISITL